MINGNTYIDSEFGHHYAVHKSESISVKDKDEMFTCLNKWLNRQVPSLRGNRHEANHKQGIRRVTEI